MTDMKKFFVLIAVLTTFCQLDVQAQGRSGGFGGGGRGRLARLSVEERGRLRAAHQQAMRDPTLRASRERFRAARREFQEKLRQGILSADPSVQPILEKIKVPKDEKN